MIRTIVKRAAVAAAVVASVAVAAPAGAMVAAPVAHGCTHAVYTRSGALTNQTGYPVWLSDSDGVLQHVLVPAGGSVPFRETLPWRASPHLDTLTTTSVDFSGGLHPVSGWQFSDPMWLMAPARCPFKK